MYFNSVCNFVRAVLGSLCRGRQVILLFDMTTFSNAGFTFWPYTRIAV